MPGGVPKDPFYQDLRVSLPLGERRWIMSLADKLLDSSDLLPYAVC